VQARAELAVEGAPAGIAEERVSCRDSSTVVAMFSWDFLDEREPFVTLRPKPHGGEEAALPN
jgi:hypothetical protein